MSQQDIEITTAYGEAMFYAHLVEDLLRLHVFECGFFHVNGCQPISKKRIKEMDFKDVIDTLGRIYPESDRLVADLHRIRRIRNHLTHAFVAEVGSDLLAEEGRDQVHAMLRRVVTHTRRNLKSLQNTHETLLREGMKKDFMRIMDREDPEFDARVARSKIECWLKEMET